MDDKNKGIEILNNSLLRIERLLSKDGQAKVGIRPSLSLGRPTIREKIPKLDSPLSAIIPSLKRIEDGVLMVNKNLTSELSTLNFQVKTLIQTIQGKKIGSDKKDILKSPSKFNLPKLTDRNISSPTQDLIGGVFTKFQKGRDEKSIKHATKILPKFNKVTSLIARSIDPLSDKNLSVGVDNLIKFSTVYENISITFSRSGGNLLKGSTKAALATHMLEISLKGFKQLSDYYNKIGDTKSSKRIMNGVTTFNAMSLGFRKSSQHLLIGSLLMIPAIVALPIAILGMWGVSKLFEYIGDVKRSQKIKRGATVLSTIGKSILFVSLGLGAFALVMGAVAGTASFTGDLSLGSVAKGLGALGIGIIAIWGISFIYDKIGSGKSFTNILKGTAAVGLITISLVGVSYALSLVMEQSFIKNKDWEGLLFMGATLGGLGVIYGIAGQFFSQIGIGSLAFLAIGASLWVVGFALEKTYESGYFKDGTDWEKLGFLGATLGGLGAIYTGLGAVGMTGLPFIGVALIGAIGGSLWALGAGLDSIFKVVTGYGDIEEVGEKFKILMSNVGLGMLAFVDPSVLSQAEESKGFFGSLVSTAKGLVTSGVNTIKVVAASAAMLTSSVSLLKMGKAFSALNESGLFNKSVEEIKDIGVNIKNLFGALGEAFDIPFSTQLDMVSGSTAIMGASKSLSNISKALQEWKKAAIPNSELVLSYEKEGLDPTKQPITLLDSIYATLNAIQKPFALIGNSGQIAKGGMAGFFGGTTNVVKDGINSVMGTQKALTSVKDGLNAWYKNRIPDKEFRIRPVFLNESSETAPETLLESIISTFMAIRKPFALIGESGQVQKGGIFGFFGGTTNVVKEGINSVMGTQKALTSVSEGLRAWRKNSIENKEFMVRENFMLGHEPTTLMESIVSVLLAIREPFAKIGAKTSDGGGVWGFLFGSQNDVEEGIKSVKDTGKSLTDIAEGLTKFKGITAADMASNLSFDKEGNMIIKGEPTLLDRILMTTTLISNVFARVGEMEKDSRKSFLGIKYGEGNVKRGIESAKEAGVTLKNIADALTVFSTLKTIDYQTVAVKAATTMKTYIESISSVGEIKGGKSIGKSLKDANKFLSENVKLIQTLETLDKSKTASSGISTFGKLFADLGKLPHDGISQMFKDMKLTIEAMKKMNTDALKQQLELYKAQARVVEAEVEKLKQNNTTIALKTPTTNSGSTTTVVNSGSNVNVLAVILAEIKEAINEMSDKLDGSAKIKVTNISDLKI